MTERQRPDAGSRANVVRRPKGSMVPQAEVRTYYDKAILQTPAWTWEVPAYVFVGGMAGMSASLAEGAELAGYPELARAARRVAAVGAAAGPPLLIADLGVPSRFHHMLRVVKVTSPLSVGSWILATFAPAAVGSAGLDELGLAPGVRRLAQRAAALLGFGMTTYTAVLFANTAVPVWHEARHALPFVFGGSGLASAGGAALLLAPDADGDAAAARRVALAGGVLELGAERAMERRLGHNAEPYHQGDAGRWATLATAFTAAGTVLVGVGRRRPPVAKAGALALLAGSFCQRWAVYRAGFQSAENPEYLVRTQRQRMAQRDDHASR
jgi:hypothetical protein